MDRQTQRERGMFHNGQADTEGTMDRQTQRERGMSPNALDGQTQRERGMSPNALDRQTQRERGMYHNGHASTEGTCSVSQCTGQVDTKGTWGVSQWTGRHRGNVGCSTMDTQAQMEHVVSHNAPAIRDRHPRDDAHTRVLIQMQTVPPFHS